jgi:hypothetical protein
MGPGTSLVLYEKPKMKNNINKLLTDLIPYFISIEVDIDSLQLYVKTLIPLKWKLKKDDNIIINKVSNTTQANYILLKPSNQDVTVDVILSYLKDTVIQNRKIEELDKKIEDKRVKEQLALEQKLENIKKKALKIKSEDEFVEFESNESLIINTEHIIDEEEEFTGIDTNDYINSIKNNEFREQPRFIQVEPSNDGLTDEEYYNMSAANIKSIDDSYFKMNNNTFNAEEFNRTGLNFQIERETE